MIQNTPRNVVAKKNETIDLGGFSEHPEMNF